MPRPRPYRRHRLPPPLLIPAPDSIPDEVPPMAKKATMKNDPPPGQALDEAISKHVDTVAVRLMASRPGAADPATSGAAPAVGAVGAIGGMSLAAMKKMIAPTIKNLLALGVQFGGNTIEDLAVAPADLLDDFIPDEVYGLIEKIAHRLHGGEAHADGPHTVGGATATGSTG